MSSNAPPNPIVAKKKNKKKNRKPKSFAADPAAGISNQSSPQDENDDNGNDDENDENNNNDAFGGPVPNAPCEVSSTSVPPALPEVQAEPPLESSHVPSAKEKASVIPLSAAKTDVDATMALDTMITEREALKTGMEELRKELETIRSSHDLEVQKLQEDLEESEAAREDAESQYETLQERVSQIKSSVADRLQRDKEQLEEAKIRIDELETTNEELERGKETLKQEVATLREDLDNAERELLSLRSRSNISQANWQRERDDLLRMHAQLKVELASTTSAMGEWEVIAMEERSRWEAVGDKVAELEEQVSSLRDALENASNERDRHAIAVDGLQRALREKDIQEARNIELREMVEVTDKKLAEMQKLVEEAEAKAAEATSENMKLTAEMERTAPMEKEAKEKSLQIGKLRHQNIILNDHLIRALKMVKRDQSNDQVDRQIISNYFLQFLSLDRADQKRFQILQIIAGYLNWTDDEKAKAGLVRGGGHASSSNAGSSLRPSLPFHRTPSSPSLNTEFLTDTSTTSKESLADLWASFLERSAKEAAEDGRNDSVSTGLGEKDQDVKIPDRG